MHGLAAAVRDAGGRALIVGGWVRDRLLGVASKDIDVEVFGIPQERLAALLASFGRVEAVGQSFAVYKLVPFAPGNAGRDEAIDVALPRRESKTGRGHKAFLVEGDPSMSIADAARRRDFTVNAISWDPLTEAYEDPFDGQGDLRRRLLRAVDPARFADDSLRVLRAIQFAARFELDIEAATAALCRRLPLDDLQPSVSGASSRSCSYRRHGRQLASRWHTNGTSSIACCLSWRRWPAASRNRSGIPKATSGRTR